MASAVYLCIVLVAVFGFTFGQLLLPFQACEIECLRKKGSTVNTATLAECNDYCSKHAYDFLTAMFSTPYPWDDTTQ